MKLKQSPEYNKNRYYGYLKVQKVTYNPYKLRGFTEIKEELDLIEDKLYVDKVYELIKTLKTHPKEDSNKDFESFTLYGFDIPEATHQFKGYDNEEYEVWSKDINKNKRFVYKVFDKSHEIKIVFISKHDITWREVDNKTLSDTELNEPESRMKIWITGKLNYSQYGN